MKNACRSRFFLLVALVFISTAVLASCGRTSDIPETPPDAGSPAPAMNASVSPAEPSGGIADDTLAETASPEASPVFPEFQALIGLLGMTKDELLKAVPETPEPVDEGGLGFDKAGVRVWFDAETYTKVAQVLIMSDKIDIGGVKLGDSYDAFKAVFGEPVSDTNGDAHFKYGDIYLSVVRDTGTGAVIAVYILAENF